MSTEWNEPEEQGDEDEGEDPGFIGGGGPAETIEGGLGGEEELDEHGSNLDRADGEEL